MKMYYVFNRKLSKDEDKCVWKNKNGYTINLSQAGKYTEQEVRGMDSLEHTAVPVEVVDAETSKIVIVSTTVENFQAMSLEHL